MSAPYFTHHARNQMRLYGITQTDVLDALTTPDRITPSDKGRQSAWKKTPTGWLRVTYIDEPQGRRVITVTPRRKGP